MAQAQTRAGLERGGLNTSVNGATAATGTAGTFTSATNGVTDFGVMSGPLGELPSAFSWQTVIGGTGAFSALKVLLEGSLDGVTWFTLDTSTATAGEIRTISGKKVRFIRANVTSATVGSGAPTVTASITV